MGRHAFILGGSGQMGLAVARTLLDTGWSVTIGSRGYRPLPDALAKRGAALVKVDREHPGELVRALGDGADALIDVTAYGPADGRQLLNVQRIVSALVVVSSSSVYRDDEGRTLDEAAQNGFPELPDPISETQPTVTPGDATYSTRKVALEHLLLDKATIPVTVLRPAAIHGPGSIHPRASGGSLNAYWMVVRRYRWPMKGRAAFILLPCLTSPS